MIALDALNAEQRDRAAEYGLAALGFFESPTGNHATWPGYFAAKMALKKALAGEPVSLGPSVAVPRLTNADPGGAR